MASSRPWWAFWRGPVAEANNPKPEKAEFREIEPIGYGLQLEPEGRGGNSDINRQIQAAQQAAEALGRPARYLDFDAMDTGDVSDLLDAVVLAGFSFDDERGVSFKVESDDTAVEDLLTAAARVGQLDTIVVPEVARDLLKYGDCFIEPLFDRQAFVGVQTYVPGEITVNRDAKNKLVQGRDNNGFPAAYQQTKNGQVIAGWLPFEMCHGRLFPAMKLTYSRKSMLDNFRKDWRALQLVETGLVAARLTRAYARRKHYVDLTDKDPEQQRTTLSNYIQRMTRALFGRQQTNDDGLPVNLQPQDDLYIATAYLKDGEGKLVPRLNRVETEYPDVTGLGELSDVEYLAGKQFRTVPSDVIGVQPKNATALTGQSVSYARFLRHLQQRIEDVLRQVFAQVLLASGKLPSTVEYRIVFPSINLRSDWLAADARFRVALTMRALQETRSIPRRFALKQIFSLSDKEIDELYRQIEAEDAMPIFQTAIDPATLNLDEEGNEDEEGEEKEAGGNNGKGDNAKRAAGFRSGDVKNRDSGTGEVSQ